MNKQCRMCKKIKSLTDFYIDIRYKNQHQSYCKSCNKQYSQKRMRSEVRKIYDRKRWKTKKWKTYHNSYQKEIRKNPYKHQKMKTRMLTYYYVKTGKILKSPCEICGEIKVEAHHKDYTKIMEVVWLCRKHHASITWPYKNPL